MSDINIFIILYLIFGFLLSFLFSFLLLKRYRKTHDSISDPNVFVFAFYYSIFSFGSVIFYILIVILDMSLFTFEELSKNEEKLIISFSKFLPTFYMLFSFFGQVNKYLIIPVLIFYNSTGYYKGCDIAWDIILRYIDVYFTKFNLIAFLIFLAVIVLATIIDAFVYSFYDWILSKTKIDSLSSFIGFIKFILNYLNFLSYITILFYIGFAIQNIVRMNSVTNNYKESRNFDLWRLGKIFIFYF